MSMNEKALKISALSLVLLALVPLPSASAQVAITNLFINTLTNRQDYFEGDTITLTGKVTDNVGNNVGGASVVIELRRPTGISMSSNFVTTGADGSFRKDIVIPFVGDPKGNYTIFFGASKNSVTGYGLISIIVTPRFGFAGGGGRSCIIATATYGSEFSPEVQFLRRFRDGLIQNSVAGQGFMTAFDSFYYSFSPHIARGVASDSLLAQLMTIILYPLLAILNLSYLTYVALGFGHELSIIGSGVVASALIGLTYVTPLTGIGTIVSGNRRLRFRPELVAYFLAVSIGLIALSYAFPARPLMVFATASFVTSLMAGGAVLGQRILGSLRDKVSPSISSE